MYASFSRINIYVKCVINFKCMKIKFLWFMNQKTYKWRVVYLFTISQFCTYLINSGLDPKRRIKTIINVKNPLFFNDLYCKEFSSSCNINVKWQRSIKHHHLYTYMLKTGSLFYSLFYYWKKIVEILKLWEVFKSIEPQTFFCFLVCQWVFYLLYPLLTYVFLLCFN